MKHTQSSLSKAVQGALVLGACSAAVPAYAVQWDFDNDFSFSVDTTVAYAAAWRTQNQDSELVAALNGNTNDGNLNFDPGLINSSLKGLVEIGGVYKNFSFFVRADAAYDYAYMNQKTDISEEGYRTYNNGTLFGGDVKRGDFPDATLDEAGKRVRLLDAFISYRIDAGNQGGGFRLGRQVISWGEASFVSGINGLQNPLDAIARTTPGAEVKEYLLPTNAIDVKWDFTNSFSMEAYYKLKWEGSTLPGVGSYWSNRDMLGPGAERSIFGPAPNGTIERIGSVEPGAGDHEWGVASRYLTEALGGANFDIYYVEANAVNPTALNSVDLGDLSNSSYVELYATGIQNYGFSMSTNLVEAQVYLDMLYSPNMPMVEVESGVIDGKLVRGALESSHTRQVVVGYTDVYTAMKWLTEQFILTGEVIYTANNVGSNKDVDAALYNASAEAWGYRLVGIAKYFAVIPGLDVDVQAFWSQDVSGNGNGLGYQRLIDQSKVFSLGVAGYYLTNWEFTARYQWLFGGGVENLVHDRDNFSIIAKYRF